MRDLEKHTCRIALVQAEPVLFNKQESLKKALAYIEEAVQSKVDLIVFPELFIPGYPVGMNFGFSVGKRTEPGREDWKRYYDASIVADEDEFTQFADTAKKYNVYISIGFSERDTVVGTLYNSNVIFEPDGSYNIQELGAQYGIITISVGEQDVTAERAAEILLQTKEIMMQRGVPFHDISLSLHQPWKDEGVPPEETEGKTFFDLKAIHIQHFPFDEIYEDGLTERIKATAEFQNIT